MSLRCTKPRSERISFQASTHAPVEVLVNAKFTVQAMVPGPTALVVWLTVVPNDWPSLVDRFDLTVPVRPVPSSQNNCTPVDAVGAR